jgi:hypothetical protein
MMKASLPLPVDDLLCFVGVDSPDEVSMLMFGWTMRRVTSGEAESIGQPRPFYAKVSEAREQLRRQPTSKTNSEQHLILTPNMLR